MLVLLAHSDHDLAKNSVQCLPSHVVGRSPLNRRRRCRQCRWGLGPQPAAKLAVLDRTYMQVKWSI